MHYTRTYLVMKNFFSFLISLNFLFLPMFGQYSDMPPPPAHWNKILPSEKQEIPESQTKKNPNNSDVELFSQIVKDSDKEIYVNSGVKLFLTGGYGICRAEGEVEISNKTLLKSSSFHVHPVSLSLQRACMEFLLGDSLNSGINLKFGRERASKEFYSKLQFHSTLDGVMLTILSNNSKAGKLSLKGGAFVPANLLSIREDECKNYLIALQGRIENIGKTGVFSNISLACWHINNFLPECKKFINVEVTAGYKGLISPLHLPIKTILGFLLNCKHHKKCSSYYAGFTLGDALSRGDFSLDILYKVVYPKSIPQFDQVGLKAIKKYHGPTVEAKYMITDSFYVKGKWENAWRHRKGLIKNFVKSRLELKSGMLF